MSGHLTCIKILSCKIIYGGVQGEFLVASVAQATAASLLGVVEILLVGCVSVRSRVGGIYIPR